MCDCITQEDAMNMSNEQAIQILKPFRDMMIDQHGCPISSAVFALDKAIEALSKQPERKTGKWIEITPEEGHDIYTVKCDQCGWYDFFETNYCGNCGVDMRGEEE